MSPSWPRRSPQPGDGGATQRKTERTSFAFQPEYGGYSILGSGKVGLRSTLLWWLNTSNPALPWYAPVPDGPTPPNGRLSGRMCTTEWLMQAPPELVRASTRSAISFDFEYTYSASGLGRSLTNAMASSTESMATIGRIGPKISSLMRPEATSGSTTIVGARYRDDASAWPPQATEPPAPSSRPLRRS